MVVVLGGSRDDSLALLEEVVTPVAEVEHGEDGGEDDAGDDVDLLGPRGELVEPRLEEVLAFAPARPELHVDLALVQLAHQALAGAAVAAATATAPVLGRTAHHRLHT